MNRGESLRSAGERRAPITEHAFAMKVGGRCLRSRLYLVGETSMVDEALFYTNDLVVLTRHEDSASGKSPNRRSAVFVTASAGERRCVIVKWSPGDEVILGSKKTGAARLLMNTHWRRIQMRRVKALWRE